MTGSPTPILVLGTGRSGTTWLTNLLLSYSGVSGLAHPLHWGALEAHLYQLEEYWGSIKEADAYLRFLHATMATDIWQISGDDPEYWLRNPTPSVSEWFLAFMDRLSQRRRTPYWTVKLDPRLMTHRSAWSRYWQLLSERYDEVGVVAIVRQRDAVLRSYKSMPGRYFRRRQSPIGSLGSTLLGLARYRHQNAHMDRVLRETGGIRIRYADLMESLDVTLQHVESRFPALGRREDLAFPRYTSFPLQGTEHFELGAFGRAADRVLSRWPALGGVVTECWDRIRGRPDPTSTKLLKARYFPSELREEFIRHGAVALIPYIEYATADVGQYQAEGRSVKGLFPDSFPSSDQRK